MYGYSSPRELAERLSGRKESKTEDTVIWIVLVLMIVVVFLRGFVYVTIKVEGASMESTLESGDIVVGNRLKPYFGMVNIGDIVVVKTLETEGSQNKLIIKRVVGLEGDVIDFDGVYLMRNGQRVEEAYVDPDKRKGIVGYVGSLVKFPYTVREGEVFVLGDNRAHSSDGRSLEYCRVSIYPKNDMCSVYAVVTQSSLENLSHATSTAAA